MKSIFRKSLRRAFWPAVILAVAAVGGRICDAAPKPKVSREDRDEAYRQLFERVFAEWDRNHDGKLDLKEINAAIRDSKIHGNESAIAVAFHRRLHTDNPDDHMTLTLEEARALGDDKQIQQAVKRNAWHIVEINHTLFLGGDPNLGTFHQGGIGDCYLLAVIGAEVYHNPEAIRNMIQPRTEGGFDVHFGNGKVIPVDPITDAELIMGAAEGRSHGVWLSVLEKAYATIGHENMEADAAVSTDFIGHGGYYAPVISRLTGHQCAGPPIGRWLKEDPTSAVDKMNELLIRLTREHRLMAVVTQGNKTLPKGLPHGHIFAVLDYKPEGHMVEMFNPWGNQHVPKGPAGLVNGYPTQHGIFYVPISDFFQIFGGFTYETDRPVKK